MTASLTVLLPSLGAHHASPAIVCDPGPRLHLDVPFPKRLDLLVFNINHGAGGEEQALAHLEVDNIFEERIGLGIRSPADAESTR